MKKLNPRGFAAVEALLILIVLGLIGGTGYYVWHSKQVVDKTLTTNTSVQPKTTLKTYTNKQYGFQFQYPASWGAADVEVEDSTAAIKAYTIEFMHLTKFVGHFQQKGWQPAKDSAVAAFTVFNDCKTSNSEGIYMAYEDSTTCVANVGSTDTTFGSPEKVASLLIQKQLTSSDISDLQFNLPPQAGLKDFTQAELKSSFEKTSDGQSSNDFITFAKSIKAL